MYNRVEQEYMVSWIADNGELFQSSYNKFFEDYSAKYKITSRCRKGYIILVANLIEGGDNDV